jgi:hypothetical protein
MPKFECEENRLDVFRRQLVCPAHMLIDLRQQRRDTLLQASHFFSWQAPGCAEPSSKLHRALPPRQCAFDFVSLVRRKRTAPSNPSLIELMLKQQFAPNAARRDGPKLKGHPVGAGWHTRRAITQLSVGRVRRESPCCFERLGRLAEMNAS